MRVALTKGTLLVPPTYFALSHALAMPELEWRAFTLVARITDPAITIPIDEASPRALGGPLPLRVAAQARGLGRMRRATAAWDPDVIHQHQATWSLPAVGAARETGAPLVVTLHGGDAYPRLGRGAGAAWNAHNRARAFEGASRLLAVSRYLADVALSAGADPERLSVHYQGVDADWWTPAPNTQESREEPIVLFVGALSRLKGVDDLARACADLVGRRQHRLVLVGDGPLAPALRAHAHVSFTGRLDREGVRDWMRRARVPVVTYPTGGTPEMIAPGASLLTRERSPEALARSIDEALAWSEDERADRGAACRAWVEKERSLRGSVDQLRETYADVTR